MADCSIDEIGGVSADSVTGLDVKKEGFAVAICLVDEIGGVPKILARAYVWKFGPPV